MNSQVSNILPDQHLVGPKWVVIKGTKYCTKKSELATKNISFKFPVKEPLYGQINVIHTKDSSFITHMLNADMAILSQTVTDTIKHTSTRERLYGDMPKPRLSTMYNRATCLLPCLFKTSGNARKNTNKMKGQQKPSLWLWFCSVLAELTLDFTPKTLPETPLFFVKCNCTSHIFTWYLNILSRLAKNLDILVI
jgi:hypothetical protein